MARNVNEQNEIEADEAGQGALPDSGAVQDVLRDYSALKTKGKKISGDMSARLTKAETQHGVNKKAFRTVATCTRMEPNELHSFLRHFDAYREYADLDAMAGSDMFEGATAGPRKAAGKANGNGAPKEASPAKPPKTARKPKAGPKPGKGSSRKKKPEGEPVSAAEAAAVAWGLGADTETHGAA